VTDAGDSVPQRDRAVLEAVQALAGSACRACGAALCGHAAVLSLVLGYRHQPRCAPCLGKELREEPLALAERSLQWIARRDCFRGGWLWASESEGHAGALRPPCLFAGAPATAPAPLTIAAGAAMADDEDDEDWDAGALGCGDLVLKLRERLRAMPAGAVLRLRALDPGAPQDIPAWCGLTGHALLLASHPEYWIRRKPR
jgi:tRNA 2-thiouridine synthesizing protein A